MKKTQAPKKPLQLQRETIRTLEQIHLQGAQGGAEARSDDPAGCGYTFSCTVKNCGSL
jgi:hypothetical protein